tara:strand:- start:58 stop:651 length:594 start_codon:yes stop_codon:yes gene_type:complete
MSFRIEEKLYIDTNCLTDFRQWLVTQKISTLYPKRKIRSIYFDNSTSQIFLDSEEGCVPRRKIRLRNYPDHKDSKFLMETKISSIEGRFKKKEVISNAEKNKKLNFGIFDIYYGLCKPNLIVEYDREYYDVNNVRLTIDTNIKYSNFDNKSFSVNDKQIIVELKPAIKTSFDFLINKFPFQRIRFSKYCNAYKSLFY